MLPFTAGPSGYCQDEAETSATTATRSHISDSDSTATLLSDSDSDSSYAPSEDSVVPPSLVTNDSDTRYPGLQLNSANYSVSTTSNPTRRRWDRRNVCPYCEVPQAKFARHLQLRHGDEVDVQNALSKPKGSGERKTAFRVLQNKGNYAHNVAVRVNSKKGDVIPNKRPSKTSKRRVEDFLPCEHCLGFYYRKTLWRHKRVCPRARGGPTRGRSVQADAMAQLPIPPGLSVRLGDVFNSMRMDEVTLLCKTDQTIIAFGEKLLVRVGPEAHQLRYVSQKMRELGRLLQVLKKASEEARLSDFLCRSKFYELVSAVREVCSIDEEESKSGLALKLGHSIKKCATIVLAKKIEKGEDTESVDAFLQLHQLEWTDQVSRSAQRKLADGRWNKPTLIPVAEDITKLQTCLVTEMEKSKEELSSNLCSKAYKTMAEVLLARIILFNRRRQGEAGRMKLSDWANSVNSEDNIPSSVAECLSPLEKHLGASLKRVMVRGKRGRGVPILLTREMVEAVKLLLAKREELDVGGMYVFSIPSGLHPLRGSDCLRKFVLQCGANSPRILTSGALRKHVATMSQLLNLRDNEMDQLATFMGHDIRVHREFYRLPDATVQVAKLSKMLILMESGNTAHLKGQRLDELDVTVPDAQESSSSDSELDDPNDGNPVEVTAEATAKAEKKVTKRRPWSSKEKNAVHRSCASFIRTLKVPGQTACLRAIAEEPDLKQRTWKDVKYQVHNMIATRKRRALR